LLFAVHREIAESASAFAEWNPRLKFLVPFGFAFIAEKLIEA
jgi:hypothetical protein